MRILLISDSHYYNENLKKIYTIAPADYIIHCGDSSLKPDDPLLKGVYTVQGNHDQYFELTQHIDFGSFKALVVHGHTYHIYKGYDEVVEEMDRTGCNLCFYGHTHIPHVEYIGHRILVNPGSLMFNRGHSECASYAIVDIENDMIMIKHFNLETQEELQAEVFEKDQSLIDELKKFA